MNMEQLTELFKWMTIINVGLLLFTSVLIMALKQTVCKMHANMFGIREDQVAIFMYGYLGVFKILVIVFNIVPYVALLLMR